MAAADNFRVFTRRLEILGLPYCITGSVAAGLYGEPRLTDDIDIVLLLAVANIQPFKQTFPETEFYVPPDETLVTEITRGSRGQFNLINNADMARADIYIAARDPLHKWALDHRRRETLDGEPAWIAPPEYVILRKLEAFREGGGEKHPRDIAMMLRITAIDRVFVGLNVERLGLGPQWAMCGVE